MKLLLKVIQSQLLVSILISLFVCFCTIWIRNMGWLEFLELVAYDYYLGFRSSDVSTDPRIVLVTISEEDIKREGRWPLSDSAIARLLEKVSMYKPSAVGLDIYRDIPVLPGNKQLADVFSRFKNIITVKKTGDDVSTTVPAPYMVKDMSLVGFNDIVIDTDGIVRRGLLFIDDGESISYSFSLLLAMLYLEKEGVIPQPDEHNPQYLRLGKTTLVPLEANDGGYVNVDARGYQFLLDFRGAKIPFLSFSLTDVMAGKVPEEAIKNKIVLIGVAAESVKDFFYTPFSHGNNLKIQGVELHAHIVSQLLRSALEGMKPMRYINELNEWLWILIWGLIGGMLGLFGSSFRRFLILGITSLFILMIVTLLAFRLGWWVPSVPPLLAWLLSGSLITAHISYREKMQRTVLMQLFSKHVSPVVAKEIWEHRDKFIDGGRLRPQKIMATVLFTDLQGFTSVSERLDPQTLMDWLNEYMDSMANIVIEHRGIINKYIGDSIMAIFGVPLARSIDTEIRNDAVNAVNSALSMSDKLTDLNKGWRNKNLPNAKMRIGIYTGWLVSGSIGSTQRLEYTVIGDTVNIASRLEGLSKDSTEIDYDFEESECRIIIGEETFKLLGQRFKTKRIGDVSLRGKEKKIAAYWVTGLNIERSLE